MGEGLLTGGLGPPLMLLPCFTHPPGRSWAGMLWVLSCHSSCNAGRACHGAETSPQAGVGEAWGGGVQMKRLGDPSSHRTELTQETGSNRGQGRSELGLMERPRDSSFRAGPLMVSVPLKLRGRRRMHPAPCPALSVPRGPRGPVACLPSW